MKRNSGEIVIGLLVGLALGGIALWINSSNYAQEKANRLGRDVSQAEYLEEYPGKSVLTVVAPAAAGAGVGWLLDEAGVGGKDKKTNIENQTSVNVSGQYNSVSVNSGDTTTTTTTETRTDNENSQNQYGAP
jgi:hypothetical protein